MPVRTIVLPNRDSITNLGTDIHASADLHSYPDIDPNPHSHQSTNTPSYRHPHTVPHVHAYRHLCAYPSNGCPHLAPFPRFRPSPPTRANIRYPR
jgi:hypothetical protein